MANDRFRYSTEAPKSQSKGQQPQPILAVASNALPAFGLIKTMWTGPTELSYSALFVGTEETLAVKVNHVRRCLSEPHLRLPSDLAGVFRVIVP